METVLINQRLHERMLTPFVLFAERLGSDKIGVDKRHFIGIFHCKINILRMSSAILS